MRSLKFPVEIADVDKTVSAIQFRSRELEEAAAREVARLRILDALRSIVSLRYVHSKSRLERTLSVLQKKEIASSFALFGLDAKAFSELTECHIRRLGTTRPNGWWRNNGVGRPKGGAKC
jgi:hypothetical protein